MLHWDSMTKYLIIKYRNAMMLIIFVNSRDLIGILYWVVRRPFQLAWNTIILGVIDKIFLSLLFLYHDIIMFISLT